MLIPKLDIYIIPLLPWIRHHCTEVPRNIVRLSYDEWLQRNSILSAYLSSLHIMNLVLTLLNLQLQIYAYEFRLWICTYEFTAVETEQTRPIQTQARQNSHHGEWRQAESSSPTGRLEVLMVIKNTLYELLQNLTINTLKKYWECSSVLKCFLDIQEVLGSILSSIQRNKEEIEINHVSAFHISTFASWRCNKLQV